MAPRAAGGRRATIVAVIIALHILVVVVVIRIPSRVSLPPTTAPAITVRAVAAPAREQPEPAPDIPLDPGLTEPIVAVATTTPPAAASCDVLERIGRAVAGDPAAIDALGPVAASTAPAIMIWDGHWSTAPEAQPVHRAALAALTTVDPECLDEILIGPRLIFVSVASQPISIAIGSGRWSWQELLSSDHYKLI